MDFKLILVKPRNPDNIGAAARAMANFDLEDLSVVAPHVPVWRESVEALRAAQGAAHIISAARVFDSIPDAAADCRTLLGTSSLHRQNPQRDVISLPDMRRYLAGREGPVGILFGPEKTGLTKDELSHCHAILNIPTGKTQPSMNLGQSVALVAYELAAARKTPSRQRPAAPAPSEQETERVVSQICTLLVGIYGRNWGGSARAAEIRRGLIDARLTRGAMNTLKALLLRSTKFN
ncbi:MAG: RNA methyltransferase [Elusimicrobia bacterium]|nr:RNA methyltransferase [Elusimicrobiota bacterium]